MEKRKSNNPAGRPPGVPNAKVGELREIITKAISGEYENLSATLDKIVEPEKRLEMVVKLTAFVIPKLQTVKHEDGRTDDKDDKGESYTEALKKFSDEDLHRITELLKEYGTIWEKYGGEPERFPGDEIDYSKFTYEELTELRALKVRELEITKKYMI